MRSFLKYHDGLCLGSQTLTCAEVVNEGDRCPLQETARIRQKAMEAVRSGLDSWRRALRLKESADRMPVSDRAFATGSAVQMKPVCAIRMTGLLHDRPS